MGTPTWRVVLVGGLMGLLAVAGVVALVVTGVLPGTQEKQVPGAEPVLVALVLPDEQGTNVPRVIDLYTRVGTGVAIESVDPETSATAPGTTASTLADVYSFGGGEALAQAYARATGKTTPAWVIVTADGWKAVAGTASLTVDIPADMEVFDGRALHSYSQGTTEVPAPDVRFIMMGAEYAPAGQRRSLRQQVGDRLAGLLGTTSGQLVTAVKSSLRQPVLTEWLTGLGVARRTDGS